MKRTLFILAVAIIGFASAASAATLTVVSDKLTYLPGETITLTVTGDDQLANAAGALGVLNYSGALVDNGTQTQTQLIGQYGKWTLGALNVFDDGINASAYAFAQIAGTYPQTANNLPGVLSTVTLIAKAVGVVSTSWTEGGPDALNFFGITNNAQAGSGATFSIIPEPTTAALLGLGLVGLVLGGRRRS